MAHKVLYGGLADLRPMPRTLIDEGDAARGLPLPPARRGRARHGDPVLLVTPLAAPAICFDLRRGCSLVEHLVDRAGRRTSWSTARCPSRTAAWAWSTGSTRSCPTAVRGGLRSTPAGGRCTSSAGAWAGSSRCSPPPTGPTCRSPRSPPSARPSTSRWCRWSRRCVRCWTSPTAGAARSPAPTRLHGRGPEAAGAAGPSSSRRSRSWSPSRSPWPPTSTTPTSWPRSRRWTASPANMIAYPGRTFGQLYHRFVKGNVLGDGHRSSSTTATIDLADITVPVLVFAGATDGIAPVPAVKALVPLLTGSPRGPLRDRARRPPRDADRPGRARAPPGGCSTSGSRSGPRRRREPHRGRRRRAAPQARRRRRRPPKKAPDQEGCAKKPLPRRSATKKAAARPGAHVPTRPRSARVPLRRYRPGGPRALRADRDWHGTARGTASVPAHDHAHPHRRPAPPRPHRVRLGLGGHRRLRHRPGPDAAALPHRQPRHRGRWRPASSSSLPKAWDVMLNPIAGRISDRHRRPARAAAAVAAARRAAPSRLAFALLFAGPDDGLAGPRGGLGAGRASWPARRRTRSSRCPTSRCPPR